MRVLSILQGKSPKQILHGGIKYIKHSIQKFCLYITPVTKIGVNGVDNPRVIVSLTSFPKRIKEIHLCIKTILNQEHKPDAVMLWLANEQFPNGEADLPPKLLKLKKYGLTIKWCNDIRSYKKLIPTLKEHPEAIIITTDDDVYYKKDWLAGLIQVHEQNPNEICCYRGAKITFENGEFYRYPVAPGNCYCDATLLHQQTGVGGVLYPPHCLAEDILREDIFMEIAPTNDDLWFWLMGVLNGTKVRMLNNNSFQLFYVGETQLYSLTSINDHGEQLYYKQLNGIFKRYPEALKLLKKEYDRMVAQGEK